MGHVNFVSSQVLSNSGQKKVPQIHSSVCNCQYDILPFLEDSDIQPLLLDLPNIFEQLPKKLQTSLSVLASVPSIFTPNGTKFKSLVMQAGAKGK